MKANVYVLTGRRGNSFDVWMVGATQDELLEYHREVSGKPGKISERVDRDGHEVLVLDRDSTGADYIAQYKVGIKEIIEE